MLCFRVSNTQTTKTTCSEETGRWRPLTASTLPHVKKLPTRASIIWETLKGATLLFTTGLFPQTSNMSDVSCESGKFLHFHGHFSPFLIPIL